MDKQIRQAGFSLVEVLIALTIFSIFIATFLTSQGYNITDSINMKEEINLKNLAEYKMNEVILNLPEFSEALNNKKESKDFDLEGYKNYKYEVVWKKMVVPDFSQLISNGENEEDSDAATAQDNQNQNVKKMIMDKMKENIEKIVWQVQVTVTNKDKDYSFTVSTWVNNPNAQIELNLGF